MPRILIVDDEPEMVRGLEDIPAADFGGTSILGWPARYDLIVSLRDATITLLWRAAGALPAGCWRAHAKAPRPWP